MTYCYEGPYLDNYLTESFATENGVTEVGDVDLPHDYPDWFLNLVPICGKCVEEAIERAAEYGIAHASRDVGISESGSNFPCR